MNKKMEQVAEGRNGNNSLLSHGQRNVVDNITTHILTPRQLDVAKLVAKGLSDKEIGCALSLSEETVSWHLREIFRRWGLRSRSAVAARLVESEMPKAESAPPHTNV